jgi:hypothetical protein
MALPPELVLFASVMAGGLVLALAVLLISVVIGGLIKSLVEALT